MRSGVLNSVHSFAAAPDQGLFILALLGITIGGSLLLFAVRAPVLAATGIYAPLSRESALVLNNIFLCSIAAVVFVGTLYPPFANLLFGIQLSVGAPFFNQTVLPLTAPIIVAMAVGPLLPWKRAAIGPALQRLGLSAAVALIVFLAVAANRHIIAALGLAGGIWVVLAALHGSGRPACASSACRSAPRWRSSSPCRVPRSAPSSAISASASPCSALPA